MALDRSIKQIFHSPLFSFIQKYDYKSPECKKNISSVLQSKISGYSQASWHSWDDFLFTAPGLHSILAQPGLAPWSLKFKAAFILGISYFHRYLLFSMFCQYLSSTRATLCKAEDQYEMMRPEGLKTKGKDTQAQTGSIHKVPLPWKEDTRVNLFCTVDSSLWL